MKLKAIIVSAAFMLIMLAGCNNTPSNEDQPQPFSFSESVQSTPESETPAENESKEVETTPEPIQSTAPQKQEETTEKDRVSSEQPQTVSETGQAVQPAEQPGDADKTEHSVSTPLPDASEINEAPEPPETEETPSETESDFDIAYWISFARNYAESAGLVLDSEAVYCWDNPIRAGAHCEYLARDIHSRLDRYGADEEITAVWIWVEKLSGGIYDIYIGYA